ncbi:deoxyguanosinetriphosphate triphosphohydrolase [Miniphocaeibacter halophilus]|uniref:Deoxyguanosinetriphosphate triphosphohydrolase n=1 Tax=Miniphocaeibacter halophilus TaxID=2931922 RepID=A0AC61MPP8_9FIRM|nr:deoxyguanosinetriphosphate triphosphohydrolase [Miniphocaeibacter halophilus]QQK07565.1 deoxyguanosinetriphosphate triphosphohydrolase [Miniphocaeibacter halophilus]
MYNRIDQENFEDKFLTEFAAKSKFATRRRPEKQDSIRTAYQRDRDRIIHSKSFRRLKHKTQVYISPEKDHYRTRLTHTLEVAQIARTIARALRLNEDLTEAIALGHDLGHTPFGHMGEEVLNELNPSGFKHYLHSVRVVELLENTKERFGLNLTEDVLDGIANHTGSQISKTMEGKIIKFADRIAYINHDIDDSIRAGILSEEDIPKDISNVLGRTSSIRINTLVNDIIINSYLKNNIEMSSDKNEKMNELRQFMFDRVYFNPKVKNDEVKAKGIIENLYAYYKNNFNKLPKDHIDIYKKSEDLKYSSKDEIITDYIAGMTDTFAIHKYMDLFVPKQWTI